MNTTMNHTRIQAAALALTLLAASASAADLAAKARELMAGNTDSLISVSALSKMDMGGSGLPIRIGGMDESQEAGCGGLVLDASGLTVVSYSAINPMEKIASAVKINIGDEGQEGPKLKAELSRIRMRLADGTEIPARMVLKDKELDLAFLVPEPKEGEKLPAMTPVKLGDAAAKEMDEVVVLSRHSKGLGYQPIVTTGHVTSVIRKPRALYDLSCSARPGSLVYLADGRLLGVAVVAAGEGSGLLSMGAMEVLVLPAAEIGKLAEQAKKAAEKKEGE